jgi:hypothetical protein
MRTHRDQNGFVYEREAVVIYIGNKKDHTGKAKCPQPGTTHSICVADLVPAGNILRAKKRKQHTTQHVRRPCTESLPYSSTDAMHCIA